MKKRKAVKRKKMRKNALATIQQPGLVGRIGPKLLTRSFRLVLFLLLLPTLAHAQISSNTLSFQGTNGSTFPKIVVTTPATTMGMNIVTKGGACLQINGVCIGGGGGGVATNPPYATNRDTSLAEILATGASANNDGLLGGYGSALIIHSIDNSFWDLGFWHDDDGKDNFVGFAVSGASPNNTLTILAGDGAGSFDYIANFAKSGFSVGDSATWGIAAAQALVTIGSDTLAWGPVGTITSGTFTNSVGFYVGSGSSGNFNFGPNQFQVTSHSTGPSPQMMILQQNVQSMIQSDDGASGLGTISTGPVDTDKFVTSLDSGDSTGNLHLNLFSPNNSSGTVALAVFSSTQAGAGKAPIFQFNTPNDGAAGAVALQAPDSTAGSAFIGFQLPPDHPAANGQPLVSTTAGVMSFAAGKTQAYALCTGAACATTCTLTFTGGILTANSGTCP